MAKDIAKVAPVSVEEGAGIEHLAWDFIYSVMRLALPLWLASWGGLLSERSGVAQIGLEGLMLGGALTASLTTLATGSPVLGVIAAITCGLALSSLQAFFVLYLQAEQIVVGMALNLLVFGLAPFITKFLYDTTGSTPALPIEWLATWQFFAVGAVIAGIYIYVLQYTDVGLWLRFAGEKPEVLVSQGISDAKVRFGSLLACGAMTGLAGSVLTLMLSSAYSPMMSSGRGYMALAALIFAGWRPWPTMLTCLFFAFTDALQIRMQGTAGIPVQFIQILPYVVTLVALAGFYRTNLAPKGMGHYGRPRQQSAD